MKVTLRNRSTGLFLTPKGEWVSSGLQAYDFGECSIAETRAAELNLQDVDVYFIFDDPRMNHWWSRRAR